MEFQRLEFSMRLGVMCRFHDVDYGRFMELLNLKCHIELSLFYFNKFYNYDQDVHTIILFQISSDRPPSSNLCWLYFKFSEEQQCESNMEC